MLLSLLTITFIILTVTNSLTNFIYEQLSKNIKSIIKTE